jgi:hypothetical protein
MSDYTTLLGAEEVAQAARNIAGAAEQMSRAAQPVQPIFESLIAKHPGLREELIEMDAQPVQPVQQRECRPLLCLCPPGECIAKAQAAQPVQPSERAQDLHEKAFMPWGQAEKLALEESGIGDAEIDELIGNASNTVLIGLLDEEDVREFVRSILIHQPATVAHQAVAALKPKPVAKPYGWIDPNALCADEALRWCQIDGWLTPVYTHPPQSEQVRKPLTKDEIADLWDGTLFHITDLSTATDFVRDVEAAHNIREN